MGMKRTLRGWWRAVAASGGVLLSSLAACAPVSPGQPPRTPAELVALFTRLANSGQLLDVRRVAATLGTGLTLEKIFPNTLSRDCGGSTDRSRLTSSEYLRYTADLDYMASSSLDYLARHPVVLGPLPHLKTEEDGVRVRYELTVTQDCSDRRPDVRANLSIDGLLGWQNFSLPELKRLLPDGEFVAGPDFASSYVYKAPHSGVIASFQVAYSGSASATPSETFRVGGFSIQQELRIDAGDGRTGSSWPVVGANGMD